MEQKQFFYNFGSNVGFFIINSLASVWFVSYLIHHLGVAVYGLVPLALAVVSYLNLVTFGLNTAVGRYMTIALERAEGEDAGKIFNTAFWGCIFIAAALLLPGLWLSLSADRIFNVPAGYEQQVKWLFAMTFAAFIATTVGSAFNIISYCRNRFDLQNMVTVSGVIVRILTVAILFRLFIPQLWHVSAGIGLAALAALWVSIKICRHLLPGQRIRLRDFDPHILRKISGTGAWILVNQLGTVLLLSIDLVLANKLMGPELSGRYASVMQWSSMLRNFATVVAGIFGPTILIYYARNDMDSLVDYAKKAVKFTGLVIALPVALICGLSKPLLELWLGPAFVPLAPLMFLMTFHLCLNLGYMPLHAISMATNKVKVPALVQIALGVLNLVLALMFIHIGHMGLYGIALAGALVLCAKNIIFNPIYSARIIHKPWGIFMKELLPLVTVTAAISLLGMAAASFLHINSWGRLIGTGLVLTLFYAVIAWFMLIGPQERLVVKGVLNGLGDQCRKRYSIFV